MWHGHWTCCRSIPSGLIGDLIPIVDATLTIGSLHPSRWKRAGRSRTCRRRTSRWWSTWWRATCVAYLRNLVRHRCPCWRFLGLRVRSGASALIVIIRLSLRILRGAPPRWQAIEKSHFLAAAFSCTGACRCGVAGNKLYIHSQITTLQTMVTRRRGPPPCCCL